MEICFRMEYRVFIYIYFYIGFDSLLIIFDRNWWKFEKYLYRFIYVYEYIFYIYFASVYLKIFRRREKILSTLIPIVNQTIYHVIWTFQISLKKKVQTFSSSSNIPVSSKKGRNKD